MYQKIVTYGNSILRLPSQPLIITDHFDDLIQSLFDTLSQNRGIGLAAPQIGINQRAFIINTILQAKDDLSVEKFQAAYLNPEITWCSKKENSFNEGCLSIPGIYENIVRPSSIHVCYLDASFNEVEETLYGIKARIFQHEYDHLEGILFVDHLHLLHKILIFYKLKRLQNNLNKHTML
jgi:peptide deformylase